MRSPGRFWLRLLSGLFVSAFFLIIIARDLDPDGILRLLSDVHWAYIVIAVLALVCGYWVRLLRWHYMLSSSGSTASLAGCARPFIIGFALNNLLPLRAGDIVRALAFRRVIKLPVATVFGTLVLERLLDLLVVSAILGIALALYERDIATPGEVGALAAALPFLVMLALSAAGVIVLASRVRLPFGPEERENSAGLRQRLFTQLQRLVSVLSHLSQARRLLTLFALTMAAWLAEVGVFAAAAWALRLPVSGSWTAMGAGTLGTLIPASPGHVGTFDYFAALGMRLHGVDGSLAVAYAVMVHAVLWLPLTALGLVFMLFPAQAEIRRG
ncbi:MAG: flippase-like domain-containing protein [Halioglobus sp.]|nr:flippase-like domain-containing protein [Halioglobus sp.]